MSALSFVLAAAACGTAPVGPPSPPDVVQVETALFALPAGDEEEAQEIDAAHPGELVLLRIDWPEASPGAFDARFHDQSEGARRTIALRGVVPGDPRLGGRDAVELLVLGLGTLELDPIDLVAPNGTILGRTGRLTLESSASLADGEAELAPQRPPLGIGLDTVGLLVTIVAGALALALAAWLVSRALRARREVPDAPEPAAPREHPAVRALREIAELNASGLLAKGAIKSYCVRLSEIGKTFEGDLASAPLRERTTAECERELGRRGIAHERIRWFTGWLDALDMVKFAGDRPAPERLDDLSAALKTVAERELPGNGRGSTEAAT